MEPTKPSQDPVAAWEAFASTSNAPPIEPYVPETPEWRWGWSAWIGIHYGPIPVGIILVLPLLIALRC